MIEKGNKKTINAWAFYDWANSVYPLVITTAIFPTFYQTVTTRELADGGTSNLISFFGNTLPSPAVYSYVVGASFLVVSFLSPILGGLADYWGNKKFFLKLFCYLGALSCGTIYFFDVNRIELSMLSIFFASIGFWGSLVYYNAYLPEIAEPQDHDKISAKGFSLGYFGSSLLLISILVAIMVLGMKAKWAFVLVMLWWIGFAQYTFTVLPHFSKQREAGKHPLWKGIQELKKVFIEIQDILVIKRYLLAFFVYSMGVQTVLLMAVLFAAEEINWGDDSKSKTGLIVSVLIIQFIAIAGAGVFSRMSKRYGNIRVLKVAVVIWFLVCVWAYTITTPVDFYITAAAVGFVMGGVQALSRSTYSKMLPETKDHASYFSFYDVLEKLGIFIGMFSFGWIVQLTGSMRNSIFVLGAFFIVGLILLFFVPRHKWTN
ncbi:MAG: MFS transporter [Crocinitomicaceae bacterium]|nr:MFS transporter [Crocinitomicaceae bacterium]|tara:strand:+ start:7151 stop:8443 length:1293 start_codon:yes stop_codon:yes gene_type:complete